MLSRLVLFIKKPFIRNVTMIATGTAMAQIISVSFAPIITRLYGPEAFGVLGVFSSIVAIVTPVAALTYPIAIVLPSQDSDAKGLIRLSLIIAALIAMLMIVLLLIFNNSFVHYLKIEVIEPYLFLIPLAMFLGACLQVTQQWLIRKRQFKIRAKITVIQSLIINSVKTFMGFINPIGAVLVLVNTIGTALHALMLMWSVSKVTSQERRQKNEEDRTPSLWALAKSHHDFPLYRGPQVFINSISQSLPILMLSAFFGPAAAGFYSISRTVMGLPSRLISQSVGDVFYPRITQGAHDNENITRLIIKATLALAVVGIVPFAIIVVFGPSLFGFLFGQEWVKAGEYARWLALWLFGGFINKPSVIAIPVLGFQKALLIYEIFSTVAKILALSIGFFIFSDDVIAVALFSIFGVFAYVYLILWVILKSMNYKNRWIIGESKNEKTGR